MMKMAKVAKREARKVEEKEENLRTIKRKINNNRRLIFIKIM